MSDFEQLAIHSDNHGRPELIYAIDKYYGSHVQQLVNGDEFDGADTKAAMQALCEVGAKLQLGNHEWDFLGSVLEIDEDQRHMYAMSIWPRTHHGVLESYGGVYPTIPTPINAMKLWDRIPEKHKQLLLDAEIFTETDDYLIVHGGVTSEPWDLQREYLVYRQKSRQEDNRYVTDEFYVPPQLRESEMLCDENVALSGLGKLLVNGHFHREFTTFDDRWSENGDRLYLATDSSDKFALVWENWTGDLVRIASDGTCIDRAPRPVQTPSITVLGG